MYTSVSKLMDVHVNPDQMASQVDEVKLLTCTTTCVWPWSSSDSDLKISLLFRQSVDIAFAAEN